MGSLRENCKGIHVLDCSYYTEKFRLKLYLVLKTIIWAYFVVTCLAKKVVFLYKKYVLNYDFYWNFYLGMFLKINTIVLL